MTNAELADKYALAGWIDITEVDDPGEWQQIIAALRQPSSEKMRTRALLHAAQICKECRVSLQETAPIAVAQEIAEQLFYQILDLVLAHPEDNRNDEALATMVLVPRVPTLAMLEAGRISQSFGDEELDLDDMRFKWKAMLAAAKPSSPSGGS